MALPCTFVGVNTTIGGGSTGATDIPAHVDHQSRTIYTCWRFSPAEVRAISEHGQAWIRVHGAIPPMYVMGEDPFAEGLEAIKAEDLQNLHLRSERLQVIESEIRSLHPSFFDGDNVVAALLRKLRAEA